MREALEFNYSQIWVIIKGGVVVAVVIFRFWCFGVARLGASLACETRCYFVMINIIERIYTSVCTNDDLYPTARGKLCDEAS